MILNEFNTLCYGEIQVISGFNGKILCRNFKNTKHKELGDREVIKVWTEIRTTSDVAFSSWAKPIICVYVDGAEECRKALNIKREN